MARRAAGNGKSGGNSLAKGLQAWAKKPAVKKPPPNSYDPNLDAQQRAAGRGLGYLQGDTEQANTRADTQLTVDQGLLRRGRDRSLADLMRQRTDMVAGYQRQGESQGEAANAAGLVGGGTLAAALKARQGNQAHDESGIALAEQRVGEDYGPEDPNAAGYDLGRFGQVGRQYAYGVNDRATELGRAGTELGAFTQDTGEQRWYQARTAGYVPPTNAQVHSVGGLLKKKMKRKK